MSYTYWCDLKERLSESEQVDYLRRVLHRDAPFDPLHNLQDAWELTENAAFRSVELDRENRERHTYNCLLRFRDTCVGTWYATTPQEAIVDAVMEAYDCNGVRF